MALVAKGKVSSKGWVVIPSEIRKRYKIKSGQEVQFVPDKDHLNLIPAMEDPVHQTSGKYKEKTSLTKALLESRKEEIKREQRQKIRSR